MKSAAAGLLSDSLTILFFPKFVLDWCQTFVSAQYLENKLNEFDQILYVYSLTLT